MRGWMVWVYYLVRIDARLDGVGVLLGEELCEVGWCGCTTW